MRLLLLASSVALLLACAHGSPEGGVKGSLLVPFAPAGVSAPAARPKRLALVVGIDHFQDEDFKDLSYARADAQAMAAALAPSFDEVMLRIREQDTSRTAILRALAELGSKASHPEDTVLIYFSSHGSLVAEPGGALKRYLVTQDSSMALLAETGLPVDGLVKVLDGMSSRRKVMILATCHSGRGKSRVDDRLSRALAAMKSGHPAAMEEASEASIVLTASAFGDTARESPELGHDIYTYFFLQALKDRAGDRDKNGAVTASEAHDFARDGTWLFTQGRQRPTAESQIMGRDPIVLSGRIQRSGLPVVFSYAPSAEGLALYLDGQEKGRLPGGVALPRGEHQISIRRLDTGEELYRDRLELAEGQALNLTEVLPRGARWSVQAQGAFFWPLQSSLRREYLPMSLGAGLSLDLQDAPWQQIRFSLRLTYLNGSGQATGFAEVLDYRFHALDACLLGGRAWRLLPALQLTLSGRLGLFWALRDFHSDSYRENDEFLAMGFGAGLGLQWSFLDAWALELELGLSALLGHLDGDLGPHPFLGVQLSIGRALNPAG